MQTFDVEEKKTEIRTKETREILTEKKMPVLCVCEKYIDVDMPKIVERFVETETPVDKTIHKPVKQVFSNTIERLRLHLRLSNDLSNT